MSDQLRLWNDGADQPEIGWGLPQYRESTARELRYLLTISTETGRAGRLTPSGLAYSLSVCLIEDWHMARGKGKGDGEGNVASMPRFVDVKLTQEQKTEFRTRLYSSVDLVQFLQSITDDGYRVGCAWNSESQSYTVSLTCRDKESVNNGLCMTSFAKDIPMAIALARYKHEVVCGGQWSSAAGPSSEDFG